MDSHSIVNSKELVVMGKREKILAYLKEHDGEWCDLRDIAYHIDDTTQSAGNYLKGEKVLKKLIYEKRFVNRTITLYKYNGD